MLAELPKEAKVIGWNHLPAKSMLLALAFCQQNRRLQAGESAAWVACITQAAPWDGCKMTVGIDNKINSVITVVDHATVIALRMPKICHTRPAKSSEHQLTPANVLILNVEF